MHEGREWAKEPAPDASGIFEIQTDPDDAAEENVHQPFVIRVGDELTIAILSLEQQVENGSENRLRPDPSEHAEEQEQDRDREDHLSRHV